MWSSSNQRWGSRLFWFLGLALILAGVLPLRANDVLMVADRLARQHLSYVYGSDEPGKGGFDCSGFVEFVFQKACGIDLPNQADLQLDYCRTHGQVWDATSTWTPATLQPGDLIFFAGPQPSPRTSEVTHVMLYCGNNVMVGAQTEGWQVDGSHAGVGYYKIPNRYPVGILGESGERFIGHRRIFAYGRINGIVILKSSLALPPAPPTVKPASDPYPFD